ncbi:MAG: two-component sensor histidine kinase [Desulfobacterales bacterium]|nr:two-component sensor histidine kinase [Desulfobacterales bacterium]
MSIIKKIKPKFWDHYDAAAGSRERPFSFRRKWKLIVLLTTVTALTPLIVMTYIDYRLSRTTVESEARMGLSKTVSNAWRTVSFFMAQRETALDFVARDNTREALLKPGRLSSILENLKMEIGGFKNIAVMDADGRVQAHAGPPDAEGVDPRGDACFDAAVKHGKCISDVETAPGGVRRLVMAERRDSPRGGFFILWAALDVKPLCDLLLKLEIDERDDAFIINGDGVLQTMSRYHGAIGEKAPLPVPEHSPRPRVIETRDKKGERILMAWANIPGTPFILVIVKPKSGLMTLWFRPRLKLIGFLIVSIAMVLVAILGAATYLVNRIHTADQKRVEALHQVEYSNKLASLGRLASGVAHEVNNPLAIINQKAGLIKDLFTYREEYAGDPKLMELVDSVLASVERCGSITRRLLNFARHMDSRIHPIDIEEVIREVLVFLEKEAERRKITVSVERSKGVPQFESDQGSLQQIFLNLFNNAFAALEDGGRLEIFIKREAGKKVSVIVADNGRGIPEEDLKRVFDPFFSTMDNGVGTGLGLSITYGLVKKVGGDIRVRSKMGKGTRFTITLPLEAETSGSQST